MRREWLDHMLAVVVALLLVCVNFWHSGVEFVRLAGLALLLVLAVRERDFARRLLVNPTSLLLLGFLLVAAAGLAITGKPLGELNRIVNWLLVMLLGLAAAMRLEPGLQLRLLLAGPVTAVTVAASVLGLREAGLWSGDIFLEHRLELFSNHPIILGTLYAMFFLAAAAVGFKEPDRRLRVTGWILAALLVPLFLMTDSRGCLLALGPAALVLAVRVSAHPKRVAAFFVVLAVLGAGGLWLAPGDIPHIARIRQAMTKPWEDPTWQSRRVIYHVAGKAFEERPLLGQGFNEFKSYHRRDVAENLAEYEQRFPVIERVVANGHNFFLHFLAETGLLGAALMSALWLWALFRGLASPNPAQIAAGAMLVFLMLAFQLNMSLYPRLISVPSFLLLGMAASTLPCGSGKGRA